MIVLKLGGSLLSRPSLIDFLQLASQQGQGKLVIVPGGGIFADQVRLTQKQWHYSDKIAHEMAILAMQQMALLFQGICPCLALTHKVTNIHAALQQHRVILWSPLLTEIDQDEVPANWDITSDSLAAWLALKLNSPQLILVKSVTIPDNASLAQLSQLNIIDQGFSKMVDQTPLTIDCISEQQLSFLATCLHAHV